MDIHDTATSVVADSIAAQVSSFVAALKSGETQALAQLYSQDAELMPPNADVVRGRDAIRKAWQTMIDAGMTDVRLETAEVHEADSLAFETGRFEIYGASGETVDRGKYIVIWRQEGGQWKIFRDIWNSSLPART